MKTSKPLFPLFLLLLLLPTLSFAATPFDYCDRQLEQEIRSAYSLDNLDQYRGYLREILNHSREALRDYVNADDGSIPAPLPIARDILLAEDANQETRRLLDTLRLRYAPSPELVLSDRDFQDFASRVLEGTIVARWQQCKTICTECLANTNGKQNGILYRVHGDQHGVFAVTFTYLPERKTDPVSVMVTGVTVSGGGVLNPPEIIRRGAILHRYNGATQTFSRTDPALDVSIRVDLDGREGVQIRISDRRPEAGLPVGAIIPSILSWEQYAKVANDTLPYDSRRNYWAPCDGRSIEGSRLQENGNHPNAPDLRGVFLRGMNRFANDEPVSVAGNRKDPDAGRKVASFQGYSVGGHGHGITVRKAEDQEPIRTTRPHSGIPIPPVAWHVGDPPGDRKPTQGNPTGETRPKNVALHYYIKIN